ncbi:transcriptional repressor LexA [Miltoncostaea oceani]|jgi:repressor LexA|uniref:transcriptional repressor LexA n=1 Tax=Miltoncostaea oceani TaxID=2843216 RepID=UPI001C3E6DA6|nr:transcriptional repressor LexA [Miltoncostaea oceani]
MDELTERQSAILSFISRHCRDTGYPPTVREIGLGVGLASPSTVHAHLAKLESGGHIRRDPTKPRAMFVCQDAVEAPAPVAAAPHPTALPLVGSVAAGVPRLAEEDVEDWVTTPFEGDFMLRVTGESMMNAGILDGDLVVVRRADTARDGEIVVGMIGEEATVKRLRRIDGRVHLMPENDAFEPIVPDELTLAGVVVGVLRKL